MDSLRYWVAELRGRFRLTSHRRSHASSTTSTGSRPSSTRSTRTRCSQVKLIAEPWDVGPGGYQVGNFPFSGREWNGLYRDTMRDFWRGQAPVGEPRDPLHGLERPLCKGRPAALRLHQLRDRARRLHARADLVSYNQKRNEANLEENRDGTDDNRSWNCGVEGPTDDPEINALRERQVSELPRHALPLPGRADAARRRRDPPDAERQQQPSGARTTRPLGRLGARRAAEADARVRAAADRAAERAPGLPALAVPRGAGDRLGPAGRLAVPARRSADGAPRLANGHEDAGRLPERPGDPGARRAGRAARRALVPRPPERGPRAGDVRAPAAAVRPPLGARAFDG